MSAHRQDEIAKKGKREAIIREGRMQLSTLPLAASTNTPLKPHASAPALCGAYLKMQRPWGGWAASELPS